MKGSKNVLRCKGRILLENFLCAHPSGKVIQNDGNRTPCPSYARLSVAYLWIYGDPSE